MRLIPAGGVIGAALLACSCAHVKTTSFVYESGDSAAVKLGESVLSARLLPTEEEGGFAMSAMVYGYVTVKKTGPYQMEIVAENRSGARTLKLERVELISGGRDEVMSRDFLGSARFADGVARWKFVGEVYLDPKKEKAPSLLVDVRISGGSREETGRVRLPLSVVTKSEREFVSLPAELMSAVRGEEEGKSDP